LPTGRTSRLLQPSTDDNVSQQPLSANNDTNSSVCRYHPLFNSASGWKPANLLLRRIPHHDRSADPSQKYVRFQWRSFGTSSPGRKGRGASGWRASRKLYSQIRAHTQASTINIKINSLQQNKENTETLYVNIVSQHCQFRLRRPSSLLGLLVWNRLCRSHENYGWHGSLRLPGRYSIGNDCHQPGCPLRPNTGKPGD